MNNINNNRKRIRSSSGVQGGLCILPIFFLLFFYVTNAQKAARPLSAKLITTLSFKTFNGGIIILRATLGDHTDSLNFILDTGSSDISLDSATCVKYQITPELSDRLVMGIGGVRQMKIAYNQKMHLPGLSMDSLNPMVADYDILSSVYGEKIDGILGGVFFSRYIVKIDYDSAKIYVYTKGAMKYPRGGFLSKPTFTVIPVQSTYVRDYTYINSHFYFDIGAGLCLLLSTDVVSDSGLLKPAKKPLSMQAHGMGGKADIKVTVVDEVKIGPYRFKKVPTYIFADEYNITNYPAISGLLGNDLLRRFNIIFNYSTKDIYLYPNTHYRDPFDYSYTGMNIFLIDGKIRVGEIMKGSPAEKAGLHEDDIIVGMNNNFTGNIQEYSTLLQSATGKIIVVVKRGNQTEELKLKPISIL